MLEDQRLGDDEQQHDRGLAGLEQRVLRVRVDEHRDRALRPRQQRVAMVALALERPHVLVDEIGDAEGVDGGDGGDRRPSGRWEVPRRLTNC
jgi:hypothetical protein